MSPIWVNQQHKGAYWSLKSLNLAFFQRKHSNNRKIMHKVSMGGTQNFLDGGSMTPSLHHVWSFSWIYKEILVVFTRYSCYLKVTKFWYSNKSIIANRPLGRYLQWGKYELDINYSFNLMWGNLHYVKCYTELMLNKPNTWYKENRTEQLNPPPPRGFKISKLNMERKNFIHTPS